MRSVLLLSSVLAISSTFAFAVGCSSSEGDTGTGSEAATAADISLARSAIAAIAGAQAHCNQCHTASKTDVLRWGNAMQQVERDCLSPTLTLTNAQRLACLRTDPTDPASYEAGKLGLYAAGATNAQFQALFGVGDGGTSQAFEDFKATVQMPLDPAKAPMTDAQFATVKKWVLAGMPAIDEALIDPDLGPCRTSLTPALSTHLAAMKNDGWAARHRDSATPMYGCGTEQGGNCLKTLPDVTATWNNQGQTQMLRQLRVVNLKSHWWIRSSPDGRFTGFGLNNGAKLVDNTKPAGATPIDVKASYDPQFFPDNSGFSFAGTNGGNGPIKVCKMSVALAAPTTITLNETGCSSIISSVYQTVSASLDGSYYMMSTGTHVNDDGPVTGQGPRPGFDASASTILTPMVSDGVKFVAQPNVVLPLPFEGDQALSPSNKLLVTRFGSTSGKRGLRIRKLDVTATPSTTGGAPTFAASTSVVGTVCVNAAKGAVSYDERFLVSHQFVDPTENPELPANSSNVVLVDLLTGEVARLTTMKANQYAFAPHFRADGWIYFVVRDSNSPTETIVASDAALRRLNPAEPPPPPATDEGTGEPATPVTP